MKWDWRGKTWSEKTAKQLAIGMGYVGLRVERYAKAELYKGHGVLTGTLRRSIHTAQSGYNWTGDRGGGQMGSQTVEATLVGKKLVVQCGSGLEYARPVEDGHHSFGGYHYMQTGVDKTKPEAADILKGHLND